MSVTFVQYLRPDGKQSPITIKRDEMVTSKYKRLMLDSVVFTAEVIPGDEVYLSVEFEETVIASALVPNGPDVPATVDKVIHEAYSKFYIDQLRH